MNTILPQPFIALAPLGVIIWAVIGPAIVGALSWLLAKLANFFTTKAVAIALVSGLLLAILVIPVTIWAVAETKGISLGILTSDPFAGAPEPLPWMIGLVDMFVPIKFALTTGVVIVLMRFTAVNLTTIYSAVSKMISSRT